MATPKKPDDNDEWLPPVEGTLWTNREGKDDRNYIEIGKGTVDLDGLWLERVHDEKAGWYGLDLVQIVISGQLVHVALDYDSKREPDAKLSWHIVEISGKDPAVATVGSPTFHGDPLGPGPGSGTVFCGGKPVWRAVVDSHMCTAATPQPHGAGSVVLMGPKPTVFVEGWPIARAGDPVIEMMGGPNPIMMGEKTVWAGAPAPLVRTVSPVPEVEAKDEDSWVTKARKWVISSDIEVKYDETLGDGEFKGTSGLGVDVDDFLVGARLDGASKGTVSRGEVSVKFTIRLAGGHLLNFSPIDFAKRWEFVKGTADTDIVFDPIQKRKGGDVDTDFDWGELEDIDD